MKRFSRQCIVCVILGALFNVCVVVVLSLSVNPHTGEKHSRIDYHVDQGRHVTVSKQFGTIRLMSLNTGFDANALVYQEKVDKKIIPSWVAAGSEKVSVVRCQARGWPVLCFYCHENIVSESIGIPWATWKQPMLIKPQFNTNILIPLRPIWPGIIFNTLFYATLLWLCLFSWKIVLRKRRLRKGLCSYCGYPRGEADVCTECGHALPSAVASGRG